MRLIALGCLLSVCVRVWCLIGGVVCEHVGGNRERAYDSVEATGGARFDPYDQAFDDALPHERRLAPDGVITFDVRVCGWV